MDIRVPNKKYCAIKSISLNNRDKLITENGIYIAEAPYSGFNKVEVAVPEPQYTPLNIDPSINTQVFTVEDIYQGYSPITVNAVTSSIDSNIKPQNIKKGISILGVEGNIEFITEELTVNPTRTKQIINPTDDGFSKVTVNPVSYEIDSNITSDHILEGVTILGVEGNLIESKETTRNISQNGTYTPPSGYTGFSQVNVDVMVISEPLNITPSTRTQTFTAVDNYHGYTPVTVEKVTSAIDSRIKPENIKAGITILGVTGNIQPSNVEELEVFENGIYTPRAGYTGFSKVTVDINTVNNQDITITEEGVYTPESPYTGFGTVTVDMSNSVQEKTIIPNQTITEVTPDDGYLGLSKVTVDLTWLQEGLEDLNAGDSSTTVVNLQDKTITTSGVYTCDSGYDGLGTITVDVSGYELEIAQLRARIAELEG